MPSGAFNTFEVQGQTIGKGRFFVIAGPCVIESEQLLIRIAGFLKDVCASLSIPFILKSSFDKANRTSIHSYRGPGMDQGLTSLARVRDELGIPILTDIHSAEQAQPVADVVDVLQIPAFLARQTDLLIAAGKTGKPINIKKPQFLAPWDMVQATEKVRHTGNSTILVTERGTQFGYNNLVVDMRSMPILRDLGYPVVFDATHSVQLPGGMGNRSGGQRQFVLPLACAAVAAGADGVFLETHEDPDKALCDGPNSLPLAEVPTILKKLQQVYDVVNDVH